MSSFRSVHADVAPDAAPAPYGPGRAAASAVHNEGGLQPRRHRSRRTGDTRRARLLRPLLAVAAIASVAGVPLLAPQPAVAVPGLQFAQRTSVNDSSAEKVVYVPCPTGTRAIGGSAVVGGTTRVRVNTEAPDAYGYTVLAREPEGGVAESWYVVVTAQCAPSTSLPGLEYRRVDSVFDSAGTHGATAACSPGEKLIGMGGLLDSNGPGQDNLVLTAVRPSPDLTSVRVTGAEDETGYTGSWRASGIAVCVTPVPGQQLASASSAFDSTSFKRAVATCPTGTKIHSGGFDIGSGAGQVNLATFFLDRTWPLTRPARASKRRDARTRTGTPASGG